MGTSHKPDYIRCYRVLSLKAGCGWEQARRHYKLLSQRWHPDRYPHDPVARASAEKKQRIINVAMRAITDYHKVHGCMPLRARPKLRQPDVPGSAAENIATKQPVSQEHGSGVGTWMLLLLALPLLSAIWILWPAQEEPPVVGQLPVSPMRASSGIGLGQNTSRSNRFGFGDPPEVVRAIQGEPTSVKGNSWYFGKSMVYFKGGRVAGWLNHIEAPLRANSDQPSSEGKLIRIGSSHAEVSRIQGEPLFKTASRWDYGPSYIEFRHNKVSSWHNSPMRPLRVGK